VKYGRIVVKYSGGALRPAGADATVDPGALEKVARDLVSLVQAGTEVAVVVGGGNIFRGRDAEHWGIERAEADNIGMVATVINGLFLRGALAALGLKAVRVMTAVPMAMVAEPYIRLRALRHLEKGRLVILTGGSGQPYQTTDYPAVVRAAELRAEALLVAKDGVSGVFEQDPRLHPGARAYQSIASRDVMGGHLAVMDPAAVLLAAEHRLPIHVVGVAEAGALERAVAGEDVGTLIHPDAATVFRPMR
jgi:uridylate kinase